MNPFDPDALDVLFSLDDGPVRGLVVDTARRDPREVVDAWAASGRVGVILGDARDLDAMGESMRLDAQSSSEAATRRAAERAFEQLRHGASIDDVLEGEVDVMARHTVRLDMPGSSVRRSSHSVSRSRPPS